MSHRGGPVKSCTIRAYVDRGGLKRRVILTNAATYRPRVLFDGYLEYFRKFLFSPEFPATWPLPSLRAPRGSLPRIRQITSFHRLHRRCRLTATLTEIYERSCRLGWPVETIMKLKLVGVGKCLRFHGRGGKNVGRHSGSGRKEETTRGPCSARALLVPSLLPLIRSVLERNRESGPGNVCRESLVNNENEGGRSVPSGAASFQRTERS